jgi:intracellular multiplication protein IcmW
MPHKVSLLERVQVYYILINFSLFRNRIAMPKLDLQSSHEFWKNYDDPMIYRVISFMESVETWTMDGNGELEQILNDLSDQLDKLTRFELGKEEHFVNLCAHIKTSRILRLLQAIDTIEPGSASKVLMFAEENNTPDNLVAGLFLRRNIVFERLRLLARVFAPNRFELVLKALEQENV